MQQRHFGDAVRLEVADNCSGGDGDLPAAASPQDDQPHPASPNLVRLMQVPDWVERPDLKYSPFVPASPKALDKRRQILRPCATPMLRYITPSRVVPVIDLLRAAADDPQVLAIKMTVYRTGTDSVLMEHLVRAAQKGKEVTVVLELMARFDEEANITWANRLEEVGAHVVYGVFGYKTHAKLLMVVRREETACGTMCTWVPATTTRARRASTPTSAC